MRINRILLVLMLVFSIVATPLFAAHESWNHVVDDMKATLDQSYKTYLSGDAKKAKDEVDVAYFGFYEKVGFERAVMSYISGNRASVVEYQFSAVKKAMLAGAPASEVRAGLDQLISYLREDANKLDGKKESPVSVFLGSLVIITREGFEAIIIVAAILAYLEKSGNKSRKRDVYWGTGIALVASVIMAFILNSLTSATSGANQEIVEGVTMLIAVAVLFYVSNWMISKAEADAWTSYIQGQVKSSITKGSAFSLAFAAFLAVFREGAETILFYQALRANTRTYHSMVWVGLGVGCVLLVVIYLLIKFLSIKIPLKPFFTGTSILLFLMSVTFIGSGIKELQEGNVISVTPVSWISSVDVLGIYPTVETLVPQLVLLAVSVVAVVLQVRKWKRNRPGDGTVTPSGGEPA